MIKVNKLKKSFNNKIILKDISFEIKQGEVVCIIGESGSGKSTLLRCLNFLEIPDEGVIEIDNFVINSRNYNKTQILSLREKSAMIFQEFNLFLNKNVIENITFPLIAAKNKNKKEAEHIAKSCLEKVGMLDFLMQYPTTLSGGQKQRVAIARSIAVSPKILLFDEPTSALDPKWVKEILTIIKKLTELNFTMVIVTHDIKFANQIADNIIFMSDGEIIEQGKMLIQSPKEEKTKIFLHNYYE